MKLFIFLILTFISDVCLSQLQQLTKTNENQSLGHDLVIKTETRAINELIKLISKNKDENTKPELLFRLAEMYMKQSQTLRMKEQLLSDSSYKQSQMNSKQKESILLALKTYYQIIKQYPKYNQIDIVYFNSAFAEQLSSNLSKSENLYLFIINNFKSSSRKADSYFILGNMAFDRKDFELSIQRYQQVHQYNNIQLTQLAEYKTAWANYNLKRNEIALSHLRRLLNQIKNNSIKMIGISEILQSEVLFLSEYKTINEAIDYLKADYDLNSNEKPLVMLGQLYYEHGKYELLEKLFTWASNNNIDLKTLIPLQIKLCQSYNLQRKHQLTNQMIQALLQQAKELSKNEQELVQIQLEIKKIIIDRIELWQNNQKNAEITNASIDLLKNYIETESIQNKDPQIIETLAKMYYVTENLVETQKYLFLAADSSSDKKDDFLVQALALAKTRFIKGNLSKDDYLKLCLNTEQKIQNQEKKNEVNLEIAISYYEKAQYQDALKRLAFINTNNLQLKMNLIKIKIQILSIDLQWNELNQYLTALNAKEYPADFQKIINDEIENSEFQKTMNELSTLKPQLQTQKIESILAKLKNNEKRQILLIKLAQIYHEQNKYFLSLKTLETLLLSKLNPEQRNEIAKSYIQISTEIGQTKRSFLFLKTFALNTNLFSGLYLTSAEEYEYATSIFIRNLDFDTVFQIQSLVQDERMKLRMLNILKSSKNEYVLNEINIQEIENLFIHRIKGFEDLFQKAKKAYKPSLSQDQKMRLRHIQAEILKNEYLSQSIKTTNEKAMFVFNIKMEKFEKAMAALIDTRQLASLPKIQAEIQEEIIKLHNSLTQDLAIFKLQHPTHQELKSEIDSLIEQLNNQKPIKLVNNFDENKINIIKYYQNNSSKVYLSKDHLSFLNKHQINLNQWNETMHKLESLEATEQLNPELIKYLIAASAYLNRNYALSMLILESVENHNSIPSYEYLYALSLNKFNKTELLSELIDKYLDKNNEIAEFYFDSQTKNTSLTMNK